MATEGVMDTTNSATNNFCQQQTIFSVGTMVNFYGMVTANYYGTVGVTTVMPLYEWQVFNTGSSAQVFPTLTVASNGGISDFCSQLTFTPEELAELERRQKEDEDRRKITKERARQLLCSILNEKQNEQFSKDGTFELEVNGRTYRIRSGRKVERLDHTKKSEVLFCIHPDLCHELVEEDVAISQKLLLEANEAEFLRLANRWA